MCLIVSDPEIKVAEKDIVVYKRLKLDREILCSPYYLKIWSLGKLETLESSLYLENINTEDDNYYVVDQGFHAHLYVEDAIHYPGTVVYKAIIPKGSEYIIGECNEVVSNQLILIRKITWVEKALFGFIEFVFSSIKYLEK